MKCVIALLLGSASALTEVPVVVIDTTADLYGSTAEGLYGAGEACTSDLDCERTTHCNYDNVCESDTYACYDDDECRGTEVCDMANYVCVPSTPSPTEAKPGCCPGTSYQSQDACLEVDNEAMCEKKAKCGTWIETKKGIDSKQCTLYFTTTSTPLETGCCGSDSASHFDMCIAKESRDKCERSSSCHWNADDEAAGYTAVCSPPSTTSDPGCCYGNPSTAYSARWMTACTSYASERECLFNVDELAVARCHWEGLPDGYDCSQLWPTTTSTPTAPAGCCYGTSYKANDKCLMAMEQSKCESKSCLWKVTDFPEDCEMTTTTSSPDPTTTSSPAGCCRAEPSVATPSHNEKCQKRTISEAKCDAGTLCEWVVTENGNDGDECQFVTTTVEPGCCDSDNGKNFDMCNAKEDETSCERSSSCTWKKGKDEDGLLCMKDPSTTSRPGCCFINPGVAYSSKAQKSCVGYGSENECLHNEGQCFWEETDDNEDCEQYWPTTTTSTPTTTAPAGCCYGTSYKANDKCMMAMEAEKCESKGCEWLETDDPTDCVITTTETPTTTAEEGCCRGTSYQSNPDCNLGLDEKSCGRKCEWVTGGVLEEDCAITTTTSTPTTTEVGCCKGDSIKATEKCNAMDSSADCDRMSSCNWVEDGVLEEDCAPPSTTADPGCCYGNPSAAYSARWMEACKSFFTENECMMLTDDLSQARCFWEPLGTYEDCEQTWPTTTSTPTVPAGCCYGTSYKANDKCLMAMEQSKCESKSCLWMVTEDPEDCEMTTTTSTPTTTDVGCCKGTSYLSNAECNHGETEKTCGRKCEWITGGVLEVDCKITTTSTPTTTVEVGCCKGTSYLSNAECNLGETEKTCGRKCEWITGGELAEGDCDITTTESPTTTTSTPEVGCCKGTSFLSNDDCNLMTSSHSCGRKCEWIVDGVVDVDCVITTTPTPTDAPGCCKGENYDSNQACNDKGDEGGEESCSRSGKCEWISPGTNDVECHQERITEIPTASPTNPPPGCCYGESYKANSKCLKPTDQHMCEQNDCKWMETTDPTDCVITTTSTPTTTQWTTTKSTEEVGCCAGTEKKNTEMCGEKLADKCRENEKCEWRADVEDCSWPTTTSTPWLGAKAQGGAASQRRQSRQSRQESMLFGGDNAVAQTMSTQVSLSTVLLCVAAAFAVYQLYRWYANSNSKKTETVSVRPNYQSV